MKIKNLLYLLLLTTVLSSCALEKRHYRSGYYISNKALVALSSDIRKEAEANGQGQLPLIAIDDTETNAELASVENNSNAIINNPDAVVNIKSTKYEKPSTITKEGSISRLRGQDRENRPETSKSKAAGQSDDTRRIDIVSLLSLVLSVLGLLLLITVGFPFLMGTAGLILGIVGLSRIKKNPDTYMGKGFAIAGIVIGSLIILIMWLIIAFLLLIIGLMT